MVVLLYIHANVKEKHLNDRTCEHELVAVVRDGEDVRRRLLAFLPSVPGHNLRVVDRKPLVGIHGHAEEPGVRLRTHQESDKPS